MLHDPNKLILANKYNSSGRTTYIPRVGVTVSLHSHAFTSAFIRQPA